MKNKTHVPDLSTTSHRYHNRQLALDFCAILGVRMSAGSSTGMSAISSVGSSAEPRNMVRTL
jgi:hypothetical protein